MPLIENDLVFALLNLSDSRHEEASKFFRRLEVEGQHATLSCVALIEMELVYMSNGLEGRLVNDLAAASALPGVDLIPLTADEVIAAAYLRGAYGLSFFDSHYAATALAEDGIIISYDQAYEKVPGLKLVSPTSL